MYEELNDVFFSEFDKPHKYKIEYGGSGSGKSISIAQHFVLGLISGDGYSRAVFRKSFPFMKLTTYSVLKKIIYEWGITEDPRYHENKTDHYFEVGDNKLYYLSLDQSEKIKGAEFKEVWLEETTEFDEADYKQLTLRLSRDKNSEDVTLFMSFNPIDENHWVIKLVNYAKKSAKKHPNKYNIHHSTYHDNEINLSKSFIDELEGYIDQDENYYRIYCLGEPGVLKNKIYTHFSIEDSSTWNWPQLNIAPHCYGLDFGYNNPMALVEIWYFEDEFYVMERFYKSEKTTDDLAFWMETRGISHSDTIYADSAEPDRIETLCTSRKVTSSMDGEESTIWVNGFNTKPAKKDIKAGIDFVKGKKVHVCSNSENLIKESNNYKYKEDKAGNVFDEPVQVFNHALDGTRYGIFTMAVEYGLTGYHHTEEYTEDVGYGVEGGERGVYSGY